MANPVGENPNAVVGGLAGAVVTILVTLLAAFEVEITPEVSAAAVTLVTFVVIYIGKRRQPAPPA
jgi:hypothetical protein